ncbi:MAG: glycosyltransferase [Solirubrobacterales bacterium]
MNRTDGLQLSVVIATHGRRELLRRCLEALTAQTLDPAAFEVLVADDGSNDGTAQMAEGFEAPFRLRVLRLDKRGQAAAQNDAIAVAEAPVCLFVDDDVIPSPGMVAAHAAAHREGDRLLGVGPLIQRPPDARDWYAHAFASAWNDHYESLERRGPTWADCYGGNLSVPRSGLIEVGGFSTEFQTADDTELAFRLCEAGHVPTYLPEAEGVHDDQKRWWRMIQDAQRIGAGSHALIERHPAMLAKRLGWFQVPTPREVRLRRLLLALRVPAALLARLGRLLPGPGRRQIWLYFVSRYAFWQGVRSGMSRDRWIRLTHGVPVLMYHAFGARVERDRYVMPRRSFARQMRLLALLRYRAIGLEQLARDLREQRLPPRRAVVITIDDGYRDNLEIALPVLRRHGFTATVFLVSRRLGGVNDWDGEGVVSGRPLMSLDEIARMGEAGISFGAHTRTHPSLPDLADDAVADEIAGSRADLERSLGEAVHTFAYPYGRRDERAVAAAGAAGFAGACNTHPEHARLGDELMQIPRVEIRGTDSLPRFLRKLWLGGP